MDQERDLTKLLFALSGEKIFTAAPWRVKPGLRHFASSPLCCKTIDVFFFSSEDAFCKQCLENAALDHPSSSGGEQVPAELPVQLQESGVAESAISQTVQTVSDSRVSCACPDAHG